MQRLKQADLQASLLQLQLVLQLLLLLPLLRGECLQNRLNIAYELAAPRCSWLSLLTRSTGCSRC